MLLATSGWFGGLTLTRINVPLEVYTRNGLASELKFCHGHGFWLKPIGTEKPCPLCEFPCWQAAYRERKHV